MRLAALLLTLLTAAPAAAEPLFWRAGSLNWSFDDIALNTPAGTRRRTQWSQAYDLSTQSPLFHPWLGDLSTNSSFKDGFNVAQAVNTESPGQKSVAWSARGDLFPSGLRRWMRFAPNYSWSQTEQAAAADAPSRVMRLDGYGFSGGLSPETWPSFNVVRQWSDRTDPLATGALRERALNARESASWVKGPLRLSADRDRNEVEDLTGAQALRHNETRRGDLELRTAEMKPLGLRFFSLRSAAFSQDAQGVTMQRNVTSNLAVRTLPWTRGRWSHELTLNNDFARDDLAGDQSDGSAVGVLSNSERPWGGLTGSLMGAHSHLGAPSRSLSQGLSVREELLRRRLTLTQSVNGGWADAGGRDSLLSDGASLRATLSPRAGRAVTAELETAGAERLGGGGAERTQRAALAANTTLRRGLAANARWDRSRQSRSAEGLVTLTDSVTAALEGPLRPSLAASLLFTWSRSASNRGEPVETPSGSLGLEWEATRALSFNARLSSAGESANAVLGAAWRAGRTSLRLYLERREISTPRSFSHFSAALTRTF